MHVNNQTEEKSDIKVESQDNTDIRKIETEETTDQVSADEEVKTEEELETRETSEKKEEVVLEVEKEERKEEQQEEETDVQSEEQVEEPEVKQTETETEPAQEESAETEEEAIQSEPQAEEKEQEAKPAQETPKPAPKPETLTSFNHQDIKQEELAQYEETFRDYKGGQIIEGTIVGITDKEVLVDISYKSEGSIPINEFPNTEDIEINSKIKVYINKIENGEGKVSLSKKTADFHLALDKLKEINLNNEVVQGTIRQRVRGGMIVDVMGLNAFLPGSQISLKPIPNLDQFIGKEMNFRIINLDEQKKNIIVSRKKVMEEEQHEKISILMERIEVGAELDGEVKNITDYGAFIDLGGIDGLLHITDMSWGHINHPSEMLNIGDKVKVKVIGYEEEEARVSLGLKQLVPHPWENIEIKFTEGTKITGKVVNITPYGAFVELEPGVEGLVHISEMSWTKKISHPKQIVKVGDSVDAIVLSVSKEEQKISLGMKQMDANPWLIIDERYPVGTIIKGKVKSLTSFGAFVEIEEDIDGLIHISDLSWTKRIYHPKEILKKGEEVETVVLSVDKRLHRIALGLKQLTPDPWEDLDRRLPINSEITGVITKLIPKGVLVDIDIEGDLIEGFVPISHLAIPRLENPEAAFSIGDEIPMKVIELDMENRRLILSIKAYFFSKERDALQSFLVEHEPAIQQEQEEKPVKPRKEKRNRNPEESREEEGKVVTESAEEAAPIEEQEAAEESAPTEEPETAEKTEPAIEPDATTEPETTEEIAETEVTEETEEKKTVEETEEVEPALEKEEEHEQDSKKDLEPELTPEPEKEPVTEK
jgi:small subunit ribosomal protein S1